MTVALPVAERAGELFVELHPVTCVCGGFAGKAAWDSTRRPCDGGARPAIGIILDTRRWRALGSPRSEEAFREAIATKPGSA